jgi:predicted dinucleotide-binding enzyme
VGYGISVRAWRAKWECFAQIDRAHREANMKIAVVGRGNVGGGLAKRWREAGHEVVEIGREGGDTEGAEAVLLAVPSGEIADALAKVTGLEGTPVLDATNLVRGDRPAGFDSLAEYVQSLTGGPVAKAFNANFATLYDRLSAARTPPTNVYASDEEIRALTEELIRDAGYEPFCIGELDRARAVEDFLGVLIGCAQEVGPVWYRIAPPDSF